MGAKINSEILFTLSTCNDIPANNEDGKGQSKHSRIIEEAIQERHSNDVYQYSSRDKKFKCRLRTEPNCDHPSCDDFK